MRNIITLLLSCSLLLVSASPAMAQHKLQQLWMTADLPTPESVLVVTEDKSTYLFVSLIDGQGDAADGKGGVAKLSIEGAIIDKDWVAGLNAPKGMAIYKNRLYVADLNELVVIDIKGQEVIKKIPIDGAVFLNDVTVNSSGVVFVSDTRTNRVHRIEGDTASVYMENLSNANGLKVFGSNLIVGAGPELLLIGADKKPLTLAKGFAQAIDGIEMVKRGEFIVSCWPGLIYYVHANGKIELLLDSQAQKINTADIGFDPKTQRVFVPNFFKNTITAYQLQ
jgi:hypothetical protein